jgi:hypothetical protein
MSRFAGAKIPDIQPKRALVVEGLKILEILRERLMYQFQTARSPLGRVGVPPWRG